MCSSTAERKARTVPLPPAAIRQVGHPERSLRTPVLRSCSGRRVACTEVRYPIRQSAVNSPYVPNFSISAFEYFQLISPSLPVFASSYSAHRLYDLRASETQSPASFRNPHSGFRISAAFTLIEMLVVISIIAILAGFAFPAFTSVLERSKKVQAKNDLTQLSTAVNAYYTEYGKYPLPAASQGFEEDYTYSYDGSDSPPNSNLIKILQNDPSASADNPRGITFLSGALAKADGGYGVQSSTASKPFMFLDPWKRAYSICIDSDYNGKVRERGTGTLLSTGAITWSLGKEGDWDKTGIASWK